LLPAFGYLNDIVVWLGRSEYRQDIEANRARDAAKGFLSLGLSLDTRA
jgi:hypothetical protein